MLGENELPQINLAGLNARSNRKRYHRNYFCICITERSSGCDRGEVSAVLVRFAQFRTSGESNDVGCNYEKQATGQSHHISKWQEKSAHTTRRHAADGRSRRGALSL